LPFYSLMVNFFLSYLSIDALSVWRMLKRYGVRILLVTIAKLLILPVLLYYIFQLVAPHYSLSALLLTGVSAGVVAPMISNMAGGNSALVLLFVVITSALAPFTLPALIKIVLSKNSAISFLPMLQTLATVIFVPIAVVEIVRRVLPRLITPILRIQFPVSLLLFAMINLGVFYRYAPFFRQDPLVILTATLVAFILAAVYCMFGISFFRKDPVEDRLAGAVMLVNINNVLVIVFSSEFFGPVEPLVAAMYMIPFFAILIPLRYYSRIKDAEARNKAVSRT
ncbi:MAG TPA: hypothetical protein VHO84_12770, partial [Syntrophorhabdaceae bacterium]|nr:hypothetical protein [Syntrophorhabdaceae bacterium]